jgi:hypothetical protein
MIVRGLQASNREFDAVGRRQTEQAQHHIKMPMKLLPQTLGRSVRLVVPHDAGSLQMRRSQIRGKTEAWLMLCRRCRRVRWAAALQTDHEQRDERENRGS